MQSPPELLNLLAIGIRHAGQAGSLLEQEHQPGHICAGGGPELQVRVRDQLAWHQGAVSEANDGDEDLAFTYPLLTVIDRLTVPGRKIPHIYWRHSGAAYCV